MKKIKEIMEEIKQLEAEFDMDELNDQEDEIDNVVHPKEINAEINSLEDLKGYVDGNLDLYKEAVQAALYCIGEDMDKFRKWLMILSGVCIGLVIALISLLV